MGGVSCGVRGMIVPVVLGCPKLCHSDGTARYPHALPVLYGKLSSLGITSTGYVLVWICQGDRVGEVGLFVSYAGLKHRRNNRGRRGRLFLNGDAHHTSRSLSISLKCLAARS